MKPTGWLIAFLLAPLAALLVLAQSLSGFGVGYGLADAIAISCYYLIYLFYGPKRESVLQRWLPIKTKVRPVVACTLLLLSASACMYYAATALLGHDCAVFSQGPSVRSRWVGVILQGGCQVLGPVIPSLFICAVGVFAAYRALAWLKTGRPNNSSKRTREKPRAA
jgi:hypothetical protein